MSRAINLDLTHDQVRAAVLKHGAVISAIEPLFPSGTRVVLTNADHAAAMRRTLNPQVIEGAVVRTPLRTVAR
ncbi:hypothetical protein SCH01S_53_00470 [Sphingomonas changbaiensis NBRC 104936]|uniref:Uncharacterized protein n=1 Tax=Sphingomonas changbaiensis NBRC 104936 TaxID=1219043 RepID=A0A0E9MV28_9SPHN|nr:hypothetical protein [Sphingomonas changbaiensis]GAO40975.1 hypothetical protein SCH01S_53_00470 [Sphingomonas changbaiensis NBRC 104936]